MSIYKNKKAMDDTIKFYLKDRRKEFNHLVYVYNHSTNIIERRSLRKRKKELVEILQRSVYHFKLCITQKTGISIKELNTGKYQNLIETQRKITYLKQSLK